ncbi:hypothetical protein [Phenylobacterium sp.]|uniref:hypothetical protein n=1 Tax=Phenylobacterium sp. TaxID=1871053 RepID=UPI002B7C21BB|nr:hypothetical protein [Phenylobacterium sp.]HLZ76828.1 hypothetical protein [Phenylobacterium sp.]
MQTTIPAIAAAASLATALIAALTAGAAQAATCACAAPRHHHVRHLTPARYRPYYVPEYRPYRIAYAAPGPLYEEPAFIPGPPPPPVRLVRRVYEPVVYAPPPPPPPPPPPIEYVDGPGYRAVDAAYIGPDPDWRPPVRRHPRHAPICRRP